MGNCMPSPSIPENSKRICHSTTDDSKQSTNPGLSSASSTTCSTNSTFTVPSSTGSSVSSHPAPRTEGEILSSPNLKSFTFNELKSATRNFRADSLIGEGGFGRVFKGWIDEHTLAPSKPGFGMMVAVKKLKPEGFQGHKEWLAEVDYLGQLQHPHLVKLIGFCSEGDSRLLVYEYMPKGSLENHLFRRSSEPLSWATRIKIAIAAAKGLAFLHDAENHVIYRDVKTANILLGSDFNAKISDFGLAKDGPTGNNTHVSTRVMGTHGYAAPEYVATGRLSARADVYSFGVMLMELLSGRRAFDRSKPESEQMLVDWAKPYISNRKLLRIMDSRLEGQYPKKGAQDLADLALRCTDNDAKSRPRMSEVVSALEPLQDRKGMDRFPANSPMRQSASPIQPNAAQYTRVR